MKLKLATLALFAGGLLAGLTSIAPATGADGQATTTAPAVYVSITGAIAAISSTSLTVGSLACARTASSPSLDGYKVGDQVAMGCANGVFAVLTDRRTAAPTTTTQDAAGARDPISALSASSITVGSLTCTIGPTLPPIPFKVGDRVRLGCLGGSVVYVVADTETPAPQPPPSTTTTATENATGARDSITALTTSSITVGPLTCSIGPSSPTVPFRVGDRVKIGCLGGVLVYVVADADAPAAATTTTTTTTTTPPAPASAEHHEEMETRLGTITALGTTSITVDGLTCSVGASSPNVAPFAIGDQVGVGCANGVLVKIGTPQVEDDGGFKVAVQLGPISALSSDSITVGSLTCRLATTSPGLAPYAVGERVGIGCAGGILFMIGALPSPSAAPKAEVKHALVEQFHGCIRRGVERCTVAGVLHRLAHGK
jgi:hypothetical protein